MSRSEEIAEFVEDSGGIASAAQIAKAGFLPDSISYALESGAIDKLTRGVYCLPEVFDDEFAAISYRWSKCVLSHGSELYLAGLSDRIPAAIDITVRAATTRAALPKNIPIRRSTVSLPSSTSSASLRQSPQEGVPIVLSRGIRPFDGRFWHADAGPAGPATSAGR